MKAVDMLEGWEKLSRYTGAALTEKALEETPTMSATVRGEPCGEAECRILDFEVTESFRNGVLYG